MARRGYERLDGRENLQDSITKHAKLGPEREVVAKAVIDIISRL
jgi:hypothetical protein